MKISIVIPCYNSQETIETIVSDIQKLIVKNNYEYEIFLVNDHSTDHTLDLLKKISSNNNKVKVLSLSKNFGQHAAIMAALNKVTGDIIICMDDDGQTSPTEMNKFIIKIAEYDVVYAKYYNKKHSAFRNLGSKLNEYMTCKLLNKPKDLYLSSYFAAKKYVIDEVVKYKNPYPYLPGLVLRITNNISNVSIKHQDRIIGKSNYSFKKLIRLWINGFTAFSVMPLRVASVTGFLLAFIGIIFTIHIIINRLTNADVEIGWSSIMAATLVMNGVVLMSVGLIGEYVGRIYISANKSPQYIIKEEINNES